MKFMLSSITILIFSYTLFFDVAYPQNQTNEKKTTIIVNFKKNADRHFTTFGQIHPLHFDPAILSPPPHQLDTSNQLKTIIKLNVSEPNFLSLGFSVFYVEPGDSINLNYETLLATKTDFKDTITVNNGNIFFIARNGEPTLMAKNFLNNFGKKLADIKLPKQMADYLAIQHIDNAVGNYAQLAYRDHPGLDTLRFTMHQAKTVINNMFHWQLLYRLKFLYKNTKDELLKRSIQQGVINLLDHACRETSQTVDPIMLGKYLAIYNFFKEANLSENEIRAKFATCSNIIQQYILLNLLKDGLLPANENQEGILSQLTHKPFREFALNIYQTPNRGVEKSGYVNHTIRNVEIFNAKDQKVLFGDLFKSTSQPFMILDFCGSWCKPCIDELSKYQETKNLDRSKLIRPIWLFFENDKTKWLEMVKKYGLSAENCFVILGKNSQLLTKEFALLFDWQGEFPHHFVFSREGAIIQKNAASLSAFAVNDLPSPNANTMSLSTPALPPKK